METYQIQEYSQTAAAISLLREKYAGPFDTTTKEGMANAKAARAEVRGYRTTVEKLRVELKNPLLERGKLIDAEAKRITAELVNIEEPIDAAIKAEERRKEEERAAKARAEAERVAQINARLLRIRRIPTSLIGKTASEIETELTRLAAYQPDPGEFTEFLPEAIAARDEISAALETMLKERRIAEAEQARVKAEREEMARIAEAEQARVKAEREELERLRAQVATQQQPPARAQETIETPDPLAELIRALKAGETTIDGAMKDAYALGYEAGKNEAQRPGEGRGIQ